MPSTANLPSIPSVRTVAEVGCNHCGELETALEMIDTAADFCEVDVVKFQKRTPAELLTNEEYEAPHPNPRHAYGDSYGKHREFLELPVDAHRQLQARCADHDVAYSTSVWDRTAAEEVIDELAPDLLKIPSACNLDFEALEYVVARHDGAIHLSLGMTTREEEARIVEFFREAGRLDDLILYACTSGYPVPFEDICLKEITRLRETYGDDVRAIGFSGHHKGIAADVAALTLGAAWVERHFTLDRTWKGTDHAASLEPGGLRKLARDLRNVSTALTEKPTPILPIEEAQREKLKQKVETEVPS